MENDPQNPERRSEWETLVDVLAGFRPEQVEPLAAARDLELVYPLLHALTRGGLGEFFVRVAALEAFIADGRSPLKPPTLFRFSPSWLGSGPEQSNLFAGFNRKSSSLKKHGFSHDDSHVRNRHWLP